MHMLDDKEHLGRDSIHRLSELMFGRGIDPAIQKLIKDVTDGATIFVTGAGGSIGGEVCKKLKKHNPAKVIMFDVSEAALYQTHKAIGFCDKFETLLGDIRSHDRLRLLFEIYKPNFVIHAAALKHVPMLENPHNLVEAVSTNVQGTDVILRAAKRCNARVTLISTDKAVNPSSVLGLTKRIAERVVAAHNTAPVEGHEARHSVVRFGNVMNSSGSAIPLFQEQIARGGPVTITHRDMTRYMMTLGQAADLVLASLALPPLLHVLNMGEPIRIMDLARMLIRMADKELEDITLQEIGIRPGEKLDEELLSEAEQSMVCGEIAPGIITTQMGMVMDAERAALGLLLGLDGHDTPGAFRSALEAAVPHYAGTWK